MRSVVDQKLPSVPIAPRKRQCSMAQAEPVVQMVTRSLWALFASYIVWGIVVIFIWAYSPNKHSTGGVPFYGTGVPVLEQNLCALLITISLQMLLTLTLHCAEVVVNMSRDEDMWRRACSKKGTRSSYGALGSIKAAFGSWKVLCLFSFKAITHWLFGICISESGNLMYMSWEGLFSVVGVLLALALFLTYLVDRRPDGTQPATWGHLQTLVDLVDEWASDGKAMWWGDKGAQTKDSTKVNARHTGTTTRRLKPPSDMFLYI